MSDHGLTMTASTMPEIDDSDLAVAIMRTTSDYVNGIAPELPPISWFYKHDPACGEVLSGLAPTETAARKWGAAFNLAEMRRGEGREWVRENAIGGYRTMRVWYHAEENSL